MASNSTPDDSSKKNCTEDSTGKCISAWSCYLKDVYQGNVNIWWGHKDGDAGWACNNWHIGSCGKNNICTAEFLSDQAL